MHVLPAAMCTLMMSTLLVGCGEDDDTRPGPPSAGTGASGAGGSGTGAGNQGGSGAAGGSSNGGAGTGGDPAGGAGTGGQSVSVGNCDCITNLYHGAAGCIDCAEMARTDPMFCQPLVDDCTGVAGCTSIVDCMAACPASDEACLASCLGDTALPEGQAARDLHSCLCAACGPQSCLGTLMCE